MDELEALDTLLSREDMTFEEAVEYFGERIPVAADEFYKLKGKYQQLAFTVSGYTAAEVLNQFYSELMAALEEGNSLSEFRANMNDFLTSEGYKGVTPFQAENIFRTNIQTAYNAGHYTRQSDPDMMALRPYWQYRAVGDENTRDAHLAMDGRVYPADDPIWDTWYPPNGFRCRCSVSSLSARQVRERNLTVEAKPPQDIAPDPAFAVNPAKTHFDPDLTGYPDSIAKAYRERESENNRSKP